MSAYLGRPSSGGTHPALLPTYRPPTIRRTDWVSPIAVILLGLIGVLFIKSAQSYNGGTQWQMQIVWLLIGTALYVAMGRIDYHFWLKNIYLVYFSSLFVLALTLPPIGVVHSGARRWIGVGSHTLQPSEFAKIGTLLMVAYVLARAELSTVRASFSTLAKVAAVVAPPIVLIFKQPDLGSAVVFSAMVFAQLYMSNLSVRFFATVLGLFLLGVGLIAVDSFGYVQFLKDHKGQTPLELRGQYQQLHPWIPLKDYQRERIAAFGASDAVDKLNKGVNWQLTQSLIAIGSGGFSGKGYQNGTQARLGYLPAVPATNDFIMAVFLEETGFIGGVVVIGLYAILVGNTLRIAAIARDRFGQLICVGAAVILMVHVFVNIGMVQGLMPVKGIPLPLMSYGGSFVLACGILLGLVQSVYRFRREAV